MPPTKADGTETAETAETAETTEQKAEQKELGEEVFDFLTFEEAQALKEEADETQEAAEAAETAEQKAEEQKPAEQTPEQKAEEQKAETTEQKAEEQKPAEQTPEQKAEEQKAETTEQKAEEQKPAEQTPEQKAEEQKAETAEQKAEEQKPAEQTPEQKAEEQKAETAEQKAEETPPLVDTGQRAVRYATDDKAKAAAEDVLKNIPTKYAELSKKFSSGDITEQEYHVEYRAISSAEMDAKMTVQQQDMLANLNQQNEASTVEQATARFLAQPENKIFDNSIAWASLNAAATEVFNEKAFANASYDTIIKEAGNRVRTTLGLPSQTAQPSPVAEQGKGQQPSPATDELAVRRQQKQEQQAALPESLAGQPAAQTENVQTGKFSKLDQMLANADKGTSLDYEDALARMTEAEQEEWLKSGSAG